MLHRDDACAAWHSVSHWIDDACDHGDGWWTSKAIAELLADGRATLWILSDGEKPRAAIVTAIAMWEDKPVAEFIAQGGDSVNANIAEHLPTVEAWVRAQGAEEIVFRGRRGLTRVYKPYGYEEIAVTLRKAL